MDAAKKDNRGRFREVGKRYEALRHGKNKRPALENSGRTKPSFSAAFIGLAKTVFSPLKKLNGRFRWTMLITLTVGMSLFVAWKKSEPTNTEQGIAFLRESQLVIRHSLEEIIRSWKKVNPGVPIDTTLIFKQFRLADSVGIILRSPNIQIDTTAAYRSLESLRITKVWKK